MKKQLLLLLTITTFSFALKAQIHTVNIGTTQGPFDSTFVVQTGTTDSIHPGNHPGLGAYSNAEIYICDNATLKYNYPMGTSTNPIFYLGTNARLESYTSFNAAKVYMKANASIECFGGNFTSEEIRRVMPSTLISAGQLFFDSSFTQINFTFNGWPNNQSPCNAATQNNEIASHSSAITVYPNPANDKLYVINVPALKGSTQCYIYDVLGRLLLSQTNPPGSDCQIDCHVLQPGNYHLSLQHEGTILQNVVFTKL